MDGDMESLAPLVLLLSHQDSQANLGEKKAKGYTVSVLKLLKFEKFFFNIFVKIPNPIRVHVFFRH